MADVKAKDRESAVRHARGVFFWSTDGPASMRGPDDQRRADSLGVRLLVIAVPILITAASGGWFNACYQENRARRVRSEVTYDAYLKGQLRSVGQAYELCGQMLAASGQLIELTRPEFRPKEFSGDRAQQLMEQKTAVRKNFNYVERRWVSTAESLGFLMSYYGGEGDTGIRSSWLRARGAIDDVRLCASKWYYTKAFAGEAPLATEVEHACEQRFIAARQRLIEVSQAIDETRQFPWR